MVKTLLAAEREMLNPIQKNAETFSFQAEQSPGAGFGNEVGVSQTSLDKLIEEMREQRKDYMRQLDKKDNQIAKRDKQIDELIKKIGK